jgi:hypothetical protein
MQYPYDYAASEFGIHRQFNPTKLAIDVLCLLRLASDCKRAVSAWTLLKARRTPGARDVTTSDDVSNTKKSL